MDFDGCTEESNDKFVVVTENKMKFRVINNNDNRIRKVEVDGCLIKDGRKRCDYLFEIYNPTTLVIYVELKGCAVGDASKQLQSTIESCKEVHKKLNKKCFIVASRVPRSGPKVQKLQKQFYVKHQAILTVKTQQAEVNI